jgi:selenocysteine-specific elongation factor
VRTDDRELAIFLEREGLLVRLGDGLVVGAHAYGHARKAVVEEIEAAGEIALARARDLFGVGRRATQLLLERMDADGVTRRLGDRRVLRRR